MTDGTTGIPVAPITEDEMSKVHDILRRAADAIVGMSQLKVDVDSLTQRLAQLTDDAERFRKANAGLEESLYQARTQRMALEDRLTKAEQDRTMAQREGADAKDHALALSAERDDLKTVLEQTKAERDKAQYEALELQDQLKKVSDKLASVHSALGILPATEPVPAPPSSGSMVQPAPTPTDTPPTPEPVVSDPTPAPVDPVRPRRYYDQWQPGSMWDDEKRSYYIED